MTAPTPAEVFGTGRGERRPPVAGRVFGAAPWGTSGQRKRARLRDDASLAAEHLARELTRLRLREESDLDLRWESYRRAADRLDNALDALDAAVHDPLAPPTPAPSARGL